MKKKKAPEIYSYANDRETCRGIVTNLSEFTETIRFNSCSEIEFTVSDKVYDILRERWEYNPTYAYLEENELLYVNDNTEYFQYPVRRPCTDAYTGTTSDFYRLKTTSELSTSDARPVNNSSFDCNKHIYQTEFSLAPETMLLDIGGNYGYSFQQFERIEESASATSDRGTIVDYSGRLNSAAHSFLAGNGAYITCDAFIPVSAGDVISINNRIPSDANGNGYRSTNGGKYQTVNLGDYQGWEWHVDFYTSNDASTWSNSVSNNNSGDNRTQGVMRIPVSTYLPDGGYIRVWSRNQVKASIPGKLEAAFYYDYRNNSWKSGYRYPTYGIIKIWSGERRCKYIALQDTSGFYRLPMQWFVITDVKETNDGIHKTKTVTAYSYEYTLKNHLVTIEDGTLPLYTPPQIYGLVTSASWRCDHYIKDASHDIVIPKAQKMTKGLLNYVLESHPGWKIGHISSELMTRYRSISSIEDTNIYNLLMNTAQNLYRCFFVFDNNERTISAYSLRDIYHPFTSGADTRLIKLTWDNAIKSLDKSNVTNGKLTGLHTHTGDDTYGIGLLNPHGSNIIYNFGAFANDLPVGSQYRNEVINWNANYSRRINNYLTIYRNYINGSLSSLSNIGNAYNLIQSNIDMIKSQSAVSLALADYRAVVSKINTYLKMELPASDIPANLLSDSPLSASAVRNRSVELCHSADLKVELLSKAQTYWDAKNQYAQDKANYNTEFGYLKQSADHYTIKPYYYPTGVETYIDNDSYRINIHDHFVEGTWKDENIVFSDTYGANDILSTLLDALDEVWDELTTRYNSRQYDFTIDITNIGAVPDFEPLSKQMYLGFPVYFDFGKNKYGLNETASPLLLERQINYMDETDFSYTFSTDAKRGLYQFRYADLYQQISQTSTSDISLTFNE